MNIRLDAVHVTRTYGGCYEGRPSYDEMVDSAKKQAGRLFGTHRPVLVLDPEVTRTVRSERLLPEWLYIMSLEGQALDPASDGSHLIVVTWGGDARFALEPFLDRIDWKANATDYEF